MDKFELTCWSCSYHRMGGCLKRVRGWPRLGPSRCDLFDFEPGTDERDRPPEVRTYNGDLNGNARRG